MKKPCFGHTRKPPFSSAGVKYRRCLRLNQKTYNKTTDKNLRLCQTEWFSGQFLAFCRYLLPSAVPPSSEDQKDPVDVKTDIHRLYLFSYTKLPISVQEELAPKMSFLAAILAVSTDRIG